MPVPRFVRSAALKDGRLLRANLLGLGVWSVAMGVEVRVGVRLEVEAGGDY